MIIKKRRGQSGFSLLEILVAFAVLSLCLGVLLRIFAGGGQIARTADDYYRAILTAESMLNGLGTEIPLKPGITEGELEGGYRWSFNVTPYNLDQSLLGDQTLGFMPYLVELTVEWGGEEDPRAFNLETLRLIQDKSP